jgi:Ca-activated chloride channel family protein
VIRFDHTMDVLFPAAVPADREHIGQATFVGALQANALRDGAGDARRVVRQRKRCQLRPVLFLTDGAIGSQQLFETIPRRGRSSSWSASARRRIPT